jgi:hypothetical protein
MGRGRRRRNAGTYAVAVAVAVAVEKHARMLERMNRLCYWLLLPLTAAAPGWLADDATMTMTMGPPTHPSRQQPNDQTPPPHTHTPRSITCTLPTLVRLATGQLSPATALLTGAVSLQGDRGALRVLAAPMRAAGKGLAVEFPQLFAVVGGGGRGGKGRGRRRRSGREEREEALLLPEGEWRGESGGLRDWDCVVKCHLWSQAHTYAQTPTYTHAPTQPTHIAHAALTRGLFVERRLWEDDAAREECALCLRVRAYVHAYVHACVVCVCVC